GQQNFYELDNFGQLNASIIHTFFHKKLTISLHARDILRTMETKFKLDQGGIETYGSRYSDNQRFGINIRYNYGVKAKEERKGMPGFEQVQ
ncbi:MAG: TonB-dependent receptor, partial [Bacteroidetes bacterium HGW-Bacteroidetes-21]